MQSFSNKAGSEMGPTGAQMCWVRVPYVIDENVQARGAELLVKSHKEFDHDSIMEIGVFTAVHIGSSSCRVKSGVN